MTPDTVTIVGLFFMQVNTGVSTWNTGTLTNFGQGRMDEGRTRVAHSADPKGIMLLT